MVRPLRFALRRHHGAEELLPVRRSARVWLACNIFLIQGDLVYAECRNSTSRY